MIARIWTAATTPASAPIYAQHFARRVLPQLRAVDGYAGASLLRRDAGGETEFVVVTQWSSIEAVQAFAGPDAEAAVVEPEAAAALARFDARVRHYEIVVEDD